MSTPSTDTGNFNCERALEATKYDIKRVASRVQLAYSNAEVLYRFYIFISNGGKV